MIIPKEFRNFQDFQTMLLTSLLGTLISLKEDIISVEQAKSYWLNDVMLDIITTIETNDEIIHLVNDCVNLTDKEIDYNLLDTYIEKCKKLIDDNYTNYDEIDVGIIN